MSKCHVSAIYPKHLIWSTDSWLLQTAHTHKEFWSQYYNFCNHLLEKAIKTLQNLFVCLFASKKHPFITTISTKCQMQVNVF